ncbi:MAG: hypothetical protein AB7V58_15510 [Solirubrobacterales bacterium]
MGAHAQINVPEVPFADAIETIESLRGQLDEIKPQAAESDEARRAYAAMCDDLRAAYADLAAKAARKVADWQPTDEKLSS